MEDKVINPISAIPPLLERAETPSAQGHHERIESFLKRFDNTIDTLKKCERPIESMKDAIIIVDEAKRVLEEMWPITSEENFAQAKKILSKDNLLSIIVNELLDGCECQKVVK